MFVCLYIEVRKSWEEPYVNPKPSLTSNLEHLLPCLPRAMRVLKPEAQVERCNGKRIRLTFGTHSPCVCPWLYLKALA